MRYDITPVPKARETQSDKWKKRPAVMRYRAYRDRVRYKGIEIPKDGAHVTFILPMPRSWSKKVKEKMDGTPHQQTPDLDNLLKGLLDAVFTRDESIWDIRATKRWGEKGQIVVE